MTCILLLTAILLLEGAARLCGVGLPSSWDLVVIWPLLKTRSPIFLRRAGKMQSRPELARLGTAFKNKWQEIGGVPPVNFTPRPATKTHRIFCVGGSTTVGWPLSFGAPPKPMGSYPQWLQACLSAILPSKKIEVINAAFTGFDSRRNIEVVREIMQFKPQAVILYEGYNEPNFFALRRPQSFYRAHILPLHWRLAHVSRLYNLARQGIGLLGAPPAIVPALFSPAAKTAMTSDYESNLSQMIDLIESGGAIPVLIAPCYHPAAGNWNAFDFPSVFDALRAALLNLSRDRGIILIDPQKIVQQRHFLDYYHLCPEGNRRLALALAHVFEQIDLFASRADWRWRAMPSAKRLRRDFGLTSEVLARIYIFMAYANYRMGFLPAGCLLSRAQASATDLNSFDAVLREIPDRTFQAIARAGISLSEASAVPR